MTAVPTVPTFVNPNVLNDTELNQLGACLTFLLTTRPSWEIRQTTLQTVTTAVGTALTFTTEDNDSASGHSTSSLTSRYTAVYPGRYRIAGIVAWSANATGRRGGWWAVNGTPVNGSQFACSATASLDGEFNAPTLTVPLSVGDYVELFAYHEKGSNLDTQAGAGQAASRMSGIWEKN